MNPSRPAEKPNILWLTFEDASWYLFGCYGNPWVHTPVIDSLAAEGVLFSNARASAPQSSPARSSLITGCYATTYGMDLHPRAFDTPDGIFFPQLLRDEGYYCTNNNKTHYNTTLDNKSCWDECDRKASYNSPLRGDGQPFFAVFNCVASHMGRYRTFHTEGRRDYTQEGIDTAAIKLPAHLPDLPEIRSDYAANLEAVLDIDEWVGYFLKDLKDKGLDDNTIIFVFSDHGGCQPRGKGFLYETGLKVPMIAWFPEKYRSLYPLDCPGEDTRLVNFVDLGPTVLSLAGIKPPKSMEGRALMGKYGRKRSRKVDLSFGTNQLHHFNPMRSATDGNYSYIRSYIPYRQMALRNYYQWGMPGNKAWDQLVLSGKNTNPVYDQPFLHHGAEMLFDNSSDPFEICDISAEGKYAKVMRKLSKAVSANIRKTSDLGFFLPTTREEGCLWEKVRSEKYPLKQLYDLVERASVASVSDKDYLLSFLGSNRAEERFWAVVGLAVLSVGGELEEAPTELLSLMDDPDPYVAAEACLAAAYSGHSGEAIQRLATSGGEVYRKVYFSALECIALDPAMKDAVREQLPVLKEAAESLPRTENEDPGYMARGILVDLGEMSIWDMHGGESYEQGLKLNHGRRKKQPLP